MPDASRPIIDRAPLGTTPLSRSEDGRYIGRFRFRSESGSVYIIAFDTAISAWCCDCQAGRTRGKCRHLKQYRPGLPWRSEVMGEARAKARREAEAEARVKEALAAASADVIVGRFIGPPGGPPPPAPIDGTEKEVTAFTPYYEPPARVAFVDGIYDVVRSMDIAGSWYNAGERLFVSGTNRDRLRPHILRLITNGGIVRAEAAVTPKPLTRPPPSPTRPGPAPLGQRRKLRGRDEV